MIWMVKFGILVVLAAVGKSGAQTPPRGDCTSNSTLLPQLTHNLCQFGLDLFRKASQIDPNGNLVFSPLWIAMGLGLIEEAARGKTYNEIHDLFIPDIKPDQDLAALRALLNYFRNDTTNQKYFQVQKANALYFDQDIRINNDFRDLVGGCLDSVVSSVDFGNGTDSARRWINDWVAQRTDQKVSEILDSTSITSDTRLILINAIHLFADWEKPFSSIAIQRGDFFSRNQTLDVPFMTFDDEIVYNEETDYQFLAMDYKGKELTIFFIVPTQIDGLQAVEDRLGSEDLKHLIEKAEKRSIRLMVPKFEIAYRLNLKNQLKYVGINRVFDEKADLSRLSDEKGLFVSDAIHESVFKVKEEGTHEASLLTPTPSAIEARAFDANHSNITIDRPFMFYVLHNPTNAVLFIGHVNNPSAKNGTMTDEFTTPVQSVTNSSMTNSSMIEGTNFETDRKILK